MQWKEWPTLSDNFGCFIPELPDHTEHG